jgi:hypothetical protein
MADKDVFQVQLDGIGGEASPDDSDFDLSLELDIDLVETSFAYGEPRHMPAAELRRPGDPAPIAPLRVATSPRLG